MAPSSTATSGRAWAIDLRCWGGCSRVPSPFRTVAPADSVDRRCWIHGGDGWSVPCTARGAGLGDVVRARDRRSCRGHRNPRSMVLSHGTQGGGQLTKAHSVGVAMPGFVHARAVRCQPWSRVEASREGLLAVLTLTLCEIDRPASKSRPSCHAALRSCRLHGVVARVRSSHALRLHGERTYPPLSARPFRGRNVPPDHSGPAATPTHSRRTFTPCASAISKTQTSPI
jgi:hypothetical protein